MLSLLNQPTMELTRPLAEFDRLFDGLVGPMFRPWMTAGWQTGVFPTLNAWHDDKALSVEAELPGFNADDIDVSVQGDELTIRGRREACQCPEGANVVRQERWAGEFERTIRLPFPVESDNVTAQFKNGVLTLTLPKPAEIMPRKIRVRQA